MRRGRALVVAAAVLGLLGPVGGAGISAVASPAGEATNGRIAFTAVDLDYQGSGYRSGWFLADADGGNRTFVPAPASQDILGGVERIEGLAWSPDGTELAISAARESSYYFWGDTVFLFEPNGSGNWWSVTNWPPGSPAGSIYNSDPAWSPGGQALVWSSSEYWTTSDCTLMVDNAYGGAAEPLFTAPPAGTCDAEPDVSSTWDVVFERRVDSGDPQLWLLPGGATSPSELVIAGAETESKSDPTFSPDGSRVAFVMSDQATGEEQLFTSTVSGADLQRVTSDTGLCSDGTKGDPDWSPDGTTLVFLCGDQGALDRRIATVPGAGGPTTVVASPTATLVEFDSPGWQPVPSVPEPVRRVSGADRIATAIAASQAGYPTGGSADAAVLARSDMFPDALAGAPLAVKVGGPLLITWPSVLDPRVTAELQRALDPAGARRVYLLGGTGAMSPAVEAQLKAAGFAVTRIAGANRYDTAVRIAQAMGSPDLLFLATGMNFPDALAAGTAAGPYWLTEFFDGPPPGGAVLLTQDAALPSETKNYLATRTDAWVYAAGGQAAAAYPDADWAAVGESRYETAELVAEGFFGAPAGVGLATGMDFPDALAGGPLLARKNLPLLLAKPTGLPGGLTNEYLGWFSGSINEAYAFGGTGALADAVLHQTGTIIGLDYTLVSGSLALADRSGRAAPDPLPLPGNRPGDRVRDDRSG